MGGWVRGQLMVGRREKQEGDGEIKKEVERRVRVRV